MINFQTDILPLKNQLYRLALRITLDSAEAEDIVQETLIKVWDKRDSWTDIENIEAFCYTVCRNKALDYVKRQDLTVRVSMQRRTSVPIPPIPLPSRPSPMTKWRWYGISSIPCPRSRNCVSSSAILKASRTRTLRDCSI